MTNAESTVRSLAYPQTPELRNYTRYGHKETEFYITIGGYRISLYADVPEIAWIDALTRMRKQITTPDKWEME